MSDDSTRRRFVTDAVAARRAGQSDRLGGDADDGVGTSGKTGGTGGETPAPTGVAGDATVDERKRPRRGGRLAGPSGASDSGGC